MRTSRTKAQRRAAPRARNLHSLLRPLGARAARAAQGAESPALEALWHVIASIPRGQVSTYGEVARAAGLPGRARQTAYALRMAPKGLHLPWHRVLGAEGTLVFPSTSLFPRAGAPPARGRGRREDGRVPATALAQLPGI